MTERPPQLPDYVRRAPVQGGSGRISAGRANDLERGLRERTMTLAAAGKVLSVAFGRRDLPGRMATAVEYQGNLVLRVIWCIGECEEIEDLFINDEPIPAQGVSMTHYMGTPTQDVDPTLAAAIPAYADTMRIETPHGWVGVCYSVIVIEPSVLGGFPRSVRAVGKWRRVWDPRLDARVWSENGALIARELIADPVIGLGLPVYGSEECADWADSLLGGVIPRGRVSLVMARPRNLLRDQLALAAEYGEFHWDLEGPGIRMIPDAPLWWIASGNEPAQIEEHVAGLHGVNHGGEYAGTEGVDGVAFEVSDYVAFDFNVSAQSWLLEIRMRWQGPTSVAYLIDQSDRYIIDLAGGAVGPASGNIQFYDGTWVASDVPAKQDAWCVYSFHFRADGTVDIYLDGLHAGSATGVSIKDWNAPKLLTNHQMSDFGAAGVATEFRLWDVGGLTAGQVADQVAALAHRRLIGREPGLVIYCPMTWVPSIRADDVIAEQDGRTSMRLEAAPASESPTLVEVRYTEPASDGRPWGTASVTRRLPGVSSGEIPEIPTSVGLEGVFRAEDASNRALARLNRLRHRASVSWVTRDYGVEHHRGRVVRIQRPDIGVNAAARIMQVDYAGPGRYHVSAQIYDESHHPSELDLPEDTTTVPVGVITMLADDHAPPDGWELYTAADGRLIRGADYATWLPGASGGSNEIGSFDFDSSEDPLHPWPPPRFPVRWWDVGGSSVGHLERSVGPELHKHALSTDPITAAPYARRMRMVQKVGAPGLRVPRRCYVMGLDGLPGSVVQRVVNHAGRLLEAFGSVGNAGIETQHVLLNVGFTDTGHRHYDNYSGLQDQIDFSNQHLSQSTHVGHEHNSPMVALERRISRRPVAIYGSDLDYEVVPGMMFLWAGPENEIPDDWSLCDGSGGTPDFSGYFIELSGSSTGAPVAGDNTVRISGALPPYTHGHQGGAFTESRRSTNRSHKDVSHTHTYDESLPWEPPYYALAVIMYQPGA